MKANRFRTLVLTMGLILGAGVAGAQDVTPASPAPVEAASPIEAAPVTPATAVAPIAPVPPPQVSVTEQTQALPPPVSGTREVGANVNDRTIETATTPAPSWTVFGLDSTAGVMIGIVLMLVFVLAIVAVSRNEGATVA